MFERMQPTIGKRSVEHRPRVPVTLAVFLFPSLMKISSPFIFAVKVHPPTVYRMPGELIPISHTLLARLLGRPPPSRGDRVRWMLDRGRIAG